MHPIRRELEFSLFRATSVPAFAPWFLGSHPRPRVLGETEGDCRLGAAGPAARPARPPRGQMGPRSVATVQGSAFGLRVRRARIPYAYRAIGYPLRRRVRAYRCRARGCRAGSLFRLS